MPKSMTFDGESGYFVTFQEFEKLTDTDERDERIEYLEIQVSNLRDAISQAHTMAGDLEYHLGNA